MNEEIQDAVETEDFDFGGDDFSEVETETEGSEETPEAEGQPAEAEPEPEEQTPEELFDLTDEQGTRQVTRAEMTELAKKGMGFDRMAQQMSAMQQQLGGLAQYRQDTQGMFGELRSLAEQAGVDVPSYLAALQENVLVSKGMNRDEAHKWVQRQRQQQAAQAQQDAQLQQKQNEARQRQQQDISNFLRKYPDLDPKSIPQSVWDAVRDGETLVNAYGQYESQQLRAENQRLQQQLAAFEKNNKNREQSIGSMRSAGTEGKTDPFLSGFESE